MSPGDFRHGGGPAFASPRAAVMVWRAFFIEVVDT
jgi:hypothetical protein